MAVYVKHEPTARCADPHAGGCGEGRSNTGPYPIRTLSPRVGAPVAVGPCRVTLVAFPSMVLVSLTCEFFLFP